MKRIINVGFSVSHSPDLIERLGMSSNIRREVPFTQIPDWVIFHPDVSHATFRVYAAICLRTDKTRTAWPGIRRIAADIHASTRTVRLAITALEQIGAIVVTRSSDKSNRYWMPMTPHGEEVYQSVVQEVWSSEPQGGPLSTTDGVVVSTTELEPVRTTSTEQDKRVLAKASKRDPYWDGLVDLLGEPPPSLVKVQGRFVARMKKEGTDPSEIGERAKRLVLAWGAGALTLTSLEKWWARFGVPAASLTERDLEEWKKEQRQQSRRTEIAAALAREEEG